MKKLTFILSITLTLSAFAQVPSYVPANGLVGWWPFNGNANDESGNGNNGAVNGAVSLTTDRDGNLNSAYSFPGSTSAFINVTNNISQFNNGVSISVWFQDNNTSGEGRVLALGDTDGTNNGIQILKKPISTNAIQTRFRPLNNGVAIAPSFANMFPNSNWNHYVIAFDFDNLSWSKYLNGLIVELGSLNGTNQDWSPFNVTGKTFNIGRKTVGAFDPWNGKIDDIGIWNRALSSCEISELYNARSINISADAGLDESVCNGEVLALVAIENSGITQTMNVTAASSSDYTFAGDYTGADPNITAEVGDTLVFNINSPSHPFWLKTAPVTGTGSAVAVANNGTGNGTISWIPDVPGTYYYICQFHSGMTGSITVLPSSTSISWNNGITNGVSFTPTNPGYYTTTATNGGCSVSDSLFVTVNLPTNSSITASDCDSYIAPDGATYNATGNYIAVIPNAVGCDSTISIDLTITNSTIGSETITECNSFTWGANNQTYTATGQYTAVLANAVGCDSTVTLDLTIDVLSISIQPTNQTVNINTNAEFTVISSDPNATYQWQTDLGVGFQNMTNSGQYNGVTTNTLTIANTTNTNNNQQFRCIISAGACSDTSDVAVLTVNDNLGISENSEQLLNVYPNPAKETITISSDASIVGKDFSIINHLGQAVILGKIVQQEMNVDLSDLSTGVYVIRIDGVEKSSFRIMKE